jgi:hypothetical protein
VIWRKVSFGEPVYAQDVEVIPRSETIGLDFHFGGLVWNRPVAILAKTHDGTKRIPIVDITRIGLFLLWGLAFAFSIVWISTFRRKGSKKNE